MRHPHRRRNALTGEWVLVSPQRADRPWRGALDAAPADTRPAHDPTCPLCPGVTRAGGARTPDYDRTYVFDNDFPAMVGDGGDAPPSGHPLLVAEAERGACRVVCYSPRHDLDLGTLPVPAVRGVVDTWCDEYDRLGAAEHIGHVQVFENRGAAMGASNPHPHGQIWASGHLPDVALRELAAQQAHAGCLLCDYVDAELERAERVVAVTGDVVVLVPFWAVWPFEVLVVPRHHGGRLGDLDGGGRDDLAAALVDLVGRYDRLFSTAFPYSAGWHQQPTDGGAHRGWHVHGHFLPPLLRDANVRKFMVGYELLAGPQRDLTPEQAAERLRRS